MASLNTASGFGVSVRATSTTARRGDGVTSRYRVDVVSRRRGATPVTCAARGAPRHRHGPIPCSVTEANENDATHGDADIEADTNVASSNRRAVVLGSLGSLALGALSTASIAAATLAAPPRPAMAAEAASNVLVVDPDDSSPPPPPPRTKKNVVITGSNSGIGYNAAAKLAARGYSVTLACRTQAKAADAKRRIEEELGPNLRGDLIPAECDLANLASVRRFAASWHATGKPLDVLVLNAGVQYSGDNDVRRTDDGFEITVGTNHLGHFLLANLLLPDLEAAGSNRVVDEGGAAAGPRLVVTASEVHDPASPGGAVGPGAGLGNLAGLEAKGADFEMLDGSEYNADKAYKDSKLCNELFARELERRLQAAGSPIQVNSFGPGLITRTGFFRYQNPLFVKVFDIATNDIFHVAESVDGGGDCLVYMVRGPCSRRRSNPRDQATW